MAQQRGSNTTLMIDTETTYKTDPVSKDGAILPFVSESLSLNRNLISSKTIRSSRQPQMPVRGNQDVSGDINFELSPQYGRLLKHIFGGYGVAGGSAPYTHTWTIGTLPAGMVLEKAFTDLGTPKYFKYNGCKINSFKLSAKAEGMIDCSVALMGAKCTIGTSAYDATLADLGHTPFDGFEGSVSLGGSPSGIVTECTLQLDNNLDGNTYVIDGTGQRYSMPEGTAKVSGSIKTLFDSDTLLALAVANTETALLLAFTKGTGTGATAGNEKLTFYIDELKYSVKDPVISGPGGLLVELNFEGYYDDDADANALRAILLSPLAAF